MYIQNLDYIYYTAPISAAKEFMSPDLAESDIAYPSEEVLANSEGFLALPTEATQLMDSLWLSVKTSGNETTTYLIAGAILVAIAVFVTDSGYSLERTEDIISHVSEIVWNSFTAPKRNM